MIKRLDIESPKNYDEPQAYLGCIQQKQVTTVNGECIATMTYDMSSYLENAVADYEGTLPSCGATGNKFAMTPAPTPFLSEDKMPCPSGDPCAEGPSFTCPWCKTSSPMPNASSREGAYAAASKNNKSTTNNKQTCPPTGDDIGLLQPICADAHEGTLCGETCALRSASGD